MTTAIRRRVTVQPGGRIEVSASELPEGATAEVIVLVEQPAAQSNLVSLLGKARGGFSSPEEVERFIREERDAWTS